MRSFFPGKLRRCAFLILPDRMGLKMSKPAFVIAIVATSLLSQTKTGPVIEPDSTDVFFRLAPDGNLTELEPVTGVARVSAKGFIAYKASSAIIFEGPRSPVRFPSGGPALQFVVRPISPFINPIAIYHLRQLDRKKKTREVQLASGTAAPFSISTTATPERGMLTFKATRYGKNSYRITIAPLSPGEYAFGKAGGHEVFCFGVD